MQEEACHWGQALRLFRLTPKLPFPSSPFILMNFEVHSIGMVTHAVPLYVGCMQLAFSSYKRLQLRDCLSLKRELDFGLLNCAETV